MLDGSELGADEIDYMVFFFSFTKNVCFAGKNNTTPFVLGKIRCIYMRGNTALFFLFLRDVHTVKKDLLA